ncbi:UNVERIFIED_CONTAM: hypothetical protein Slati_1388800 [Sesamum latifolium]|uniref:Uncharacterized protein n=1 Tax=Sesamum latifolium TaxID=2727402 RepID=A0AAW2X2G5_9LAMI
MSFGNIRGKVKMLDEKICGLQAQPITVECKAEIGRLKDSLEEWMGKEEIMWKQQAKAYWLSAGDRNTNYFHTKANERHLQKGIKRIKDGTRAEVDSKEVSDSQSTFVPGRLIMDNVLLAYELNHFLKQKTWGKKGHTFIKLDRLSGLQINKQKLAMVFSRNVEVEVHSVLAQVLGVNVASKHNKTGCFTEDGSSNYPHNCGTESKILWVAWAKLCTEKQVGGLGFRQLRELNIALLTKQAWRVALGSGGVLNSETRDVLAAGLRWKVGDGNSILIMGHPRLDSFQPICRLISLPQDSRVAVLLNADKEWNVDLINAEFYSLVVECILGINLQDRERDSLRKQSAQFVINPGTFSGAPKPRLRKFCLRGGVLTKHCQPLCNEGVVELGWLMAAGVVARRGRMYCTSFSTAALHDWFGPFSDCPGRLLTMPRRARKAGSERSTERWDGGIGISSSPSVGRIGEHVT